MGVMEMFYTMIVVAITFINVHRLHFPGCKLYHSFYRASLTYMVAFCLIPEVLVKTPQN